jgi:hypothetical protein
VPRMKCRWAEGVPDVGNVIATQAVVLGGKSVP